MRQYADLEISLYRWGSAGADPPLDLALATYAIELRASQPENKADLRLALGTTPPVRFPLEQLREVESDPVAYGRLLARSLLDDAAVRQFFHDARVSAQKENVSLRLQLWLNAPELHALYWETLRDPDDDTPLTTSTQVIFSRYLGSDTRRLGSAAWQPVRPRARGELRALVVIANPSDLARYKLAPIDVPAELARATASLDTIPIVPLGTDEPATLDRLIARLREGYDIVYLVCHGAFTDRAPFIWLVGPDLTAQATSGLDLATEIRNLQERPSLIVLASCQSAGTGGERIVDTGDLAALGPQLAGAGVPAVLAMQGSITLGTIGEFMPPFFRALAEDGQIDRAVNLARHAVRERYDAWMPVLFMRLKSGQLWYRPGFVEDHRGYGKWSSLIRAIGEGQCTPILGAGLLEPLLGSTREIANRWAEEYGYPLEPHELDSLPQVTQYLAIKENQNFPRLELAHYLRREIVRRFGDNLPEPLREARPGQLDAMIEAAGTLRRASDPAEPHRVLASLPFKIYITTNPDNLLEAALIAAGKPPQVVTCPWNEHIERQFDDYHDEPTVERPLVYHLFGRLREPDSIVLTEDDYFDFLLGIERNRNLIPAKVRDVLGDTALLFLGFQFDDWSFRVIFRALNIQEGKRDRGTVAVQLTPEEGRVIAPERARQYLESYLGDANTSIYWGTAEEFIREVRARYAADPDVPALAGE